MGFDQTIFEENEIRLKGIRGNEIRPKGIRGNEFNVNEIRGMVTYVSVKELSSLTVMQSLIECIEQRFTQCMLQISLNALPFKHVLVLTLKCEL